MKPRLTSSILEPTMSRFFFGTRLWEPTTRAVPGCRQRRVAGIVTEATVNRDHRDRGIWWRHLIEACDDIDRDHAVRRRGHRRLRAPSAARDGPHSPHDDGRRRRLPDVRGAADAGRSAAALRP